MLKIIIRFDECECVWFLRLACVKVTKGWLKLIEQLIKSAINWCQYGKEENKAWVFDLKKERVQDVCEQGYDPTLR